MKESIGCVSACAILAIVTAACGGGPPTTPTPLPTPTRPTATLTGLVFAMTATGLKPVEGARVRLEIGSFRLDALTDAQGLYSMTGLYEGSSSITTSRDGYDTDTRRATVSGDMRLDIGVVPRVPHTVSGVVFEMTPSGRVPIEGVFVTGSWDYPVTTDSQGSFLLDTCGDSPCLFYNGDRLSIYLSKDGYQQVERDLRINGDTRFDIQLVRR